MAFAVVLKYSAKKFILEVAWKVVTITADLCSVLVTAYQNQDGECFDEYSYAMPGTYGFEEAVRRRKGPQQTHEEDVRLFMINHNDAMAFRDDGHATEQANSEEYHFGAIVSDPNARPELELPPLAERGTTEAATRSPTRPVEDGRLRPPKRKQEVQVTKLKFGGTKGQSLNSVGRRTDNRWERIRAEGAVRVACHRQFL